MNRNAAKFHWVVKPRIYSRQTDQAANEYEPLVRQVLHNRGISRDDLLSKYFRPDYDQDLYDPLLYQEMGVAVERITTAIKNQELIMIHGDYDADGVTSTALMVEALKNLGGRVEWYIPDRFLEGYGLRIDQVKKYQETGVKLLIAIDCGTTNISEISSAKNAGLDVIILDHHQPGPEKPAALAIVNPAWPGESYPFKGHSSAAVAYTLIRQLLKQDPKNFPNAVNLTAGWEKWLLDLVAISIISDMMPLTDENRVLVHYGLKVLKKSGRIGLRLLLAKTGTSLEKVNETTIGYQIGPRLNAAGRLQHASTAVKLLLTKDQSEARQLVDELERINSDRQRLTASAYEEAWQQITELGEELAGYAIFAPHWAPGILGLVAGRLAEKVWKPVAVMTELNNEIIGSVRSIGDIDIMAIMNRKSDIFVRYGGHPGASGFTIPTARREEFQNWFADELAKHQTAAKIKPLVIEAEAELSEFTDKLMTELERMGPFGTDHPRPIFVMREIISKSTRLVGAERQHLNILVEKPPDRRPMIGFRLANMLDLVEPGKRFDVVVEPSWNEWNGRREIQLKIIDLKASS